MDASRLKVAMPALPLAEAGKKTVRVTNGGQNAASFDFTYAYSIVEDLNADLAAHYALDGDTTNADEARSENDATNPTTADGQATFAADRNGRPDRALALAPGQRLDVPLAVGEAQKSTVCLWFYAEPGAHTLYHEEAPSTGATKHNELAVDAQGRLSFRGESAGASSEITFDAWQFACVSQNGATAAVYRAGEKVATLTAGALGAGLTTAKVSSTHTHTRTPSIAIPKEKKGDEGKCGEKGRK